MVIHAECVPWRGKKKFFPQGGGGRVGGLKNFFFPRSLQMGE